MDLRGRSFLAQLQRQLRHGVLPVWILQELAAAPSYGYELLQRLKAHHGNDLPVGPSTLYPALARLKRAGLVTTFYGLTSRGPLRKYYRLTDSGRDLLPNVVSMSLGSRPRDGVLLGTFELPRVVGT